jgi:hypothetical protein
MSRSTAAPDRTIVHHLYRREPTRWFDAVQRMKERE